MATTATSSSKRRLVQPDAIAVGLAGILLLGLAAPRLVAAVAGPATVPQSLVSAEVLKRHGVASDNERELGAGLARGPADPAAWSSLAALRGGNAGTSALAMSLSTGPHDGPEFWSRLDLCLADLPAIGSGLDRSLVEEQIRIGWRLAPERLVATVRNHAAGALAQAAFAGRPEAARFANMLASPG